MNIAITGSTGLIGTAVAAHFQQLDWTVTPVRRQAGTIDTSALGGAEAIVHLAGANIAGRRWSPAYKKEILESRTRGTRAVCETAAGLNPRPKVIIAVSAIGYYGIHDAAEVLDETGTNGTDFLADVCRQWEAASRPAAEAGIRVVHLRLGVVLSRKGGALAKMMPAFLFGLGGPIGSGRQVMSWIALGEIPRIMSFLIAREDVDGIVNGVAPQAVTSREFAKALGGVLRRPAVFPLPAIVVKILFGEMGKTLLLGGQHVVPKKLSEAGYIFQYPTLKEALKL